MNYVIFDTEGTGVTSKDDIIQSTFLLLNSELNPIKMYSFYSYTYVRCHPEAYKVHGLSPDFLYKASKGKAFEDYFFELDFLRMKDLIWIAYNAPFDVRMVNGVLKNNRARPYNFGTPIKSLDRDSGVHYFDLMKAMDSLSNRSYSKKLMEVVADNFSNMDELYATYNKLLASHKLNSSSEFHNSDFDVFCTWALLKRFGGKFR